MKTRVRKKPYANAMPRVRALPIVEPTVFLTLEDPNAPIPEDAKGAFVRLRPPPGTPSEAVSAWRARVAAVALEVKVLPATLAEDVPLASTRVDSGEKIGTIREEAEALARDTGRKGVEALVDEILRGVGL